MLNRLHLGLDKIGDVPGVKYLRQKRFERSFAQDEAAHYFSGIYTSFEAAAAAAPGTKPLGYDNAASAMLYANATDPFLRDYPAALWLERSFQQGMRSVFDLGGHIGSKYYSLDRVVPYPDDLKWQVCDVPAVIARGAKVARLRDKRGALSFTCDAGAMSGFDVVHASGSLQYLPQTLAEILRDCTNKPRRLILNATALHPERSYFTLNSIGTAFCPYRVQKESELVESLAQWGYALRDRWEMPKQLHIPFVEGYNLDDYVGMCLDRT